MSVKDEEQVLVAMEESCRIYVGNLVPKAKEVHLTSKFARFGTIHSIWIARKPPGFAFVRFDNSDAAHRAVKACQEIGGILIAGKAVRVEMAGDKERKHFKGSAKQQEVYKNDIVKTTLQYAIKCNQYGVRSEFECSYSSDSSQKGSERQLRNKELRSDNIKQHRTRLESQSGCQKIEGQARNMSRPKMRADYRRRKFARPRSRNPFRSRSRSRSRGRR